MLPRHPIKGFDELVGIEGEMGGEHGTRLNRTENKGFASGEMCEDSGWSGETHQTKCER